MLKLEDFFGLMIDENVSDIQPLLDTLKIDKVVRETKVVKSLIKQNGRNAAIVQVAIRQQTLKAIHSLLLADMLDFEKSFYEKEITTSSDYDRRYGAEERLLAFALQVASTKNQKMIAEDPNICTIKQLRDKAFKQTRYDKCWEILSDESRHIVSAFRNSNK